MFSYIAEQDDKITIEESDIDDVVTIETEEDGWLLVQYGIQEGLAPWPSNYLFLIPSSLLSIPSNIKGII